MAEKIKKECGKCFGKGHISAYKHVLGGSCFACNGKGFYLTTQKAIEQKEKRKATKKLKHQSIREWNEEKFKTFLNEFQDDHDFLKRMDGLNPETNGYQLAFNIMQVFEAKGKFQYNVPKPA